MAKKHTEIPIKPTTTWFSTLRGWARQLLKLTHKTRFFKELKFLDGRRTWRRSAVRDRPTGPPFLFLFLFEKGNRCRRSSTSMRRHHFRSSCLFEFFTTFLARRLGFFKLRVLVDRFRDSVRCRIERF